MRPSAPVPRPSLAEAARVAVAGFALAACIHRVPPVRMAAPTPIVVVTVIDGTRGPRFAAEPHALDAAIDAELTRRNFVPDRLPAPAFESLQATRATKTRLLALGRVLGPRALLLLVELKTSYFDEMQGGFKWFVNGRMSVGVAGDLAGVSSEEVSASAFLHQDFEGPRDAIAAKAETLAEAAGRLLDHHFAGRKGTSAGRTPRRPRPPRGVLAARRARPWSARPIYFVLLDRFAPAGSAAAKADPAGWHGGTFATLRAHLDEIQALGVGAIWLSPVTRCREVKRGRWGAYHGYWPLGWDEIEPRFGTAAELTALSSELHRRGMRLLLDLPVNDVAPESPLLRAHRDWFHPDAPILDFGDPEARERGWLTGLPDLAQEKPEVAAYLIGEARRLVARFSLDGLRLDAVRHVPVAFWAELSAELRAAAPGLFLVGEDLESDAVDLARVAGQGGFGALFDFPLRDAILGAVCEGKPVGAIAARLSLDRLDAPGTEWATLLDDHDLPRLSTECPGRGEAEAALALLFALRGVPVLTYGTEAGLEGAGDPGNRGDLDFPVRSRLRAFLARLAAMRAARPALVEGETRVAGASGDEVVIERVAPGEEAARIAVSRAGAPAVPSDYQEIARQEGGGLTVSVAVTGDAAAVGAATRAAATAFGRARLVRFTGARLPALAPGDAAAVIGAAPELGDWDPARAIPVGSSLRLPAGAYELKLVIRRASGGVDWQPGGNQILFVTSGEGTLTVPLAWNHG